MGPILDYEPPQTQERPKVPVGNWFLLGLFGGLAICVVIVSVGEPIAICSLGILVLGYALLASLLFSVVFVAACRYFNRSWEATHVSAALFLGFGDGVLQGSVPILLLEFGARTPSSLWVESLAWLSVAGLVLYPTLAAVILALTRPRT